MALRDGLVGYWPLDEDTINYVEDYGDLLWYGLPEFEQGKLNGFAARVKSAGQSRLYLDNNINYSFSRYQSFSFCLWLNYQSRSENWAEIIGKRNPQNSPWPGFRLDLWTFSDPRFGLELRSVFGTGSSQIAFTSNIQHQPNIWYYLCSVIDRENQIATLYVDGNSSKGGTISISTLGDLGQSLYPFYLNGPSNEGARIDGLFDEVAIWNRALSSSEISQLYNNGSGLSLVID